MPIECPQARLRERFRMSWPAIRDLPLRYIHKDENNAGARLVDLLGGRGGGPDNRYRLGGLHLETGDLQGSGRVGSYRKRKNLTLSHRRTMAASRTQNGPGVRGYFMILRVSRKAPETPEHVLECRMNACLISSISTPCP